MGVVESTRIPTEDEKAPTPLSKLRENRRGRAHAALTALVACMLAGPGGATGTAPPLQIEAATGLSVASGTWVGLSGTFPGRDMVQLDYPLQALVRSLDASQA